MWHTLKNDRPYVREIPGGGYAAIEVTTDTSLLGRRRYSGALIVERRASARAGGHRPPTLARVRGETADSVVRQLLPAAQSNIAIASEFLRRMAFKA